jgi:4-hydroxyphenylpyruvate dioxygenase-like putative hemolysin
VPAGQDSFVARFLERRGPSIHHVTFEVADWERAVAACARHDVTLFGERTGETRGVTWREAFIHPRDTGGLLVQFFWQAEPGVWI